MATRMPHCHEPGHHVLDHRARKATGIMFVARLIPALVTIDVLEVIGAAGNDPLSTLHGSCNAVAELAPAACDLNHGKEPTS